MTGAPQSALSFQGQLYFSGSISGTTGLFRTDGTATGTVLVKQGADGSAYDNAGSKFFFAAENGVWVSDGSTACTFITTDIVNAISTYGAARPSGLTAIGDVIYFAANSATNMQAYDRELWRSDGTEAGTVLVKNIHPDETDLNGLTNSISAGGRLFFMASDVSGQRLWVSDGTVAGTVPVSGIELGVQNLTRVGNFALFTFDNGTGREIWVSDGTAGGSRLLLDLAPGAGSIQ